MKEFICIVCPRGCHLQVDDDLNVTGNFCPRGATYGHNEATNPLRNLTSTVQLISDNLTRLPVKTSNDIPKAKMFEVMKEINKVVVKAPIKSGEVIIKNVLGLGSDIVATRSIES